jgi:hypothetical protein
MSNMKVGLLVLWGVLAGGGCAPTQLGENYGTAYYTMLESQILDPTAGRTQDPVVGLDGKAAMIAIEEYRQTFEQRDAGFDRSLITTGVKTN